jgi:colicin import membrane protein
MRGESKKMASKSKEVRIEQKKYWETRLSQRLEVLAEKGLKPQETTKDAAVKKIRAHLRETEARLKAIASLEAKAEEMARAKAEKAAAPKEKKAKKGLEKQEAQEMSKRQQKKKKKKEAKA